MIITLAGVVVGGVFLAAGKICTDTKAVNSRQGQAPKIPEEGINDRGI
jgi:hypothetical protein